MNKIQLAEKRYRDKLKNRIRKIDVKTEKHEKRNKKIKKTKEDYKKYNIQLRKTKKTTKLLKKGI